jgi:hypothetical protein
MLQRIFDFFHKGAFRKALRHQATIKDAHRAYLRRNTIEFAHAVEQMRGKGITIGTHNATGKELRVCMSLHDVFAHHLIQGRSGSGKSRYAEALILQLLQSFPKVGVVVIDGKGELFSRVRFWIAALLTRLSEKDREKLLTRIVIIDPFHNAVIPPLNFCAPLPGYPAELLAEDILGGLRRLFAESQLTVRMEVPLRNLLLAFIEAGKSGETLSLLEAKDFLTDEVVRNLVLMRVENEEVKNYFARDFPHESRGTIEAIKSRLSYLFVSEHMRLSFGAVGCIQFRDALAEGKIVLVNIGKTLLATDTAREVVGTLLLSSFVQGVFSRPMNHGPYIVTFCDEFQNFILPGLFERFYTEARAYRCFLTAICQQLAAQVSSKSLRDIILNKMSAISRSFRLMRKMRGSWVELCTDPPGVFRNQGHPSLLRASSGSTLRAKNWSSSSVASRR